MQNASAAGSSHAKIELPSGPERLIRSGQLHCDQVLAAAGLATLCLNSALTACQGRVLGAETEIRFADSAPRNSASPLFRLRGVLGPAGAIGPMHSASVSSNKSTRWQACSGIQDLPEWSASAKAAAAKMAVV